MMKQRSNCHWILREVAERQVPRTTIDIWSQVEPRLGSRAKGHARGVLARGLRQYACGLAVLLLVIGSLIFVPGARSFAADVVQRMGIAFALRDRSESHAVSVRVEPTVSADISPSLSVAEIREQITYPLLVPTWLPEDLRYVHRHITEYDPQEQPGSGKQVVISYGRTEDLSFAEGMLLFRANDGPIGAPPLLAEGCEVSVTVNGQPGYYVHGGWQDNGTGDPSVRRGDLLWDSTADDAYLTWTQDGVTYLLEAHNLGLGLDELLRIAAAMAAP